VLTGMVAPRNLGPDYVARFDRIYPDLASRYGAALDPFFLEGVISKPELMLGDGIHPNAKGVEVMARRLAPIVRRRIGERVRRSEGSHRLRHGAVAVQNSLDGSCAPARARVNAHNTNL
jgi:hypothetical protein